MDMVVDLHGIQRPEFFDAFLDDRLDLGQIRDVTNSTHSIYTDRFDLRNDFIDAFLVGFNVVDAKIIAVLSQAKCDCLATVKQLSISGPRP